MKLKKDRRGMTLVELLVSLVILLLVVTTAGTMLFASNNFYNRAAARGMDKITAESVYTLVSEKLRYATRITLTDKRDAKLEKSAWHWITISESGRLLLDGTDPYGDEFYHGKTLRLESYADSTDRLYLGISMEKGGKTYEAASFFNTLNITAAAQWDDEMPAGRKAIAAEDSNGNAINSGNPLNSESGAYLYFENEYNRIYTGTVADEIYRRTPETTEIYEDGKGYASGTYVWYQGAWWLARKGDAGESTGSVIMGPPGTNDKWKKIDTQMATQDWENLRDISHYDKGDVVSFEGKYYRSQINDNVISIEEDRQFGIGGWKEVVKDETNSTPTNTVWKDA